MFFKRSYGAQVRNSLSFNGASLVQVLQEWGAEPGSVPLADAVQRFGGWLNPFEVVRLQAGLQAVESLAPPTAPWSVGDAAAWADRAWQELHSSLKAHRDNGLKALAQELSTPVYEPYRRLAMDHQRLMDAAVDGFRGALRQRMWQGPVPLRQLAAIDALLQPLMQERLSRWGGLGLNRLEGRFHHWQAATATSGPAEALVAFHEECRRLWQAELDFRLQPLMGLMEALYQELAPC